MKGIVFDIKRFAVHDGPGIRTTVFLKGCPLSCQWCHNPESMNAEICRFTKKVRMGEKTYVEEEEIGKEMSVEDVMREILKEKVFMEESDGGVTFSGGEPLMQPHFLSEILQKCKAEGIHTAVDTSGYASQRIVESILEQTDLFLFDLKLIDNEAHKVFTGVSNKIILSNLQYLLKKGKDVKVRIPMVQGVTFTEKNTGGILNFLNDLSVKPVSVDFLPYHSTAAHKYERLKMKNHFPDMKSLEKSRLGELKKQFESNGFVVNIGG